MSNAAQGLAGIRVLDFSWAGAGPMATELLALMGADVVKVEHRSRPDLLRVANIAYGWGEANIDASSCFNDMNTGKRSLELDLKNPEHMALVQRLARVADIVCDNMRPGKIEALGLGYEQLRQVNPGVICCSLSASGRVPGGDTPEIAGYAPVFWAEGGGASQTGWPDGEPTYLRAPVDMNAGTAICAALLSALFARPRTGRGAYIDGSAIETVAACIGDELQAAALGLPDTGRQGNDRFPHAPNDTYPCLGVDQWVAVAVHTRAHWLALCDVLGAADLAAERRFMSRLTRWRERVSLHAALSRYTVQREAGELEIALQKAGVPAARSNPVTTLLADPDLVARGFWVRVEHPKIDKQRIGGLPWNTTPPLAPPVRGGPLMGEHNTQVVHDWLGEHLPGTQQDNPQESHIG